MINALDCEYNDIYVHIDKKVTGLEFKELYRCVQISTLNVYQEIDVRWGGYSQVEVELFLLKNAISGNYVYYHLMSGSDLPIKNIFIIIFKRIMELNMLTSIRIYCQKK